ncbi:MAG: hypothetical protein EHM41_00905 [Chloroflexi bacterium]|nr:MAG: hypothetical protein EHM41_00905 [Chloroflexota bacterium]
MSAEDEVVATFKAIDKRIAETVPGGTLVPWETEPAGEFGLVRPFKTERLEEPSILEKTQAARLFVPADDANNVPRVQIEVGKKDVEFADEVAYMTKLRAFDDWVIHTHLGHLDSDQKKAWLMKVYPEIFKRMEQSIDLTHKTQRDIQKLLIDGPSDLHDLWKIFLWETELRFLEGTNYALPAWPEADRADVAGNNRARTFRRGLFSDMLRTWRQIVNLTYDHENRNRAADGYEVSAVSQSPGPVAATDPHWFSSRKNGKAAWNVWNQNAALGRPRALPAEIRAEFFGTPRYRFGGGFDANAREGQFAVPLAAQRQLVGVQPQVHE